MNLASTINRHNIVLGYKSASMLQVDRNIARRLLEVGEMKIHTHAPHLSFPQVQINEGEVPHTKEKHSTGIHSHDISESRLLQNICCKTGIGQLMNSTLQAARQNPIMSIALTDIQICRTKEIDVGLVSVILLVLLLAPCLLCAISASNKNDESDRKENEKEYWKSCERIVPSPTVSHVHVQSRPTAAAGQGIPGRVNLSTTNSSASLSLVPNPQRSASLAATSSFSAKEVPKVSAVFRSPAESLHTVNPYTEYFSTRVEQGSSSHVVDSAAHVPSTGPSTRQTLPSGPVPQSAAGPAHCADVDQEVLDQTQIDSNLRGTAAASSSTGFTDHELEAVFAEGQRVAEPGRSGSRQAPRVMRAEVQQRAETELDQVLMARQQMVEASGSQRELWQSPSQKALQNPHKTNIQTGELESLLQQRQRAVEASNSQRELYQSPRLGKSMAPASRAGELERVFAKRRPDG